jgi:hypothetical protein
MLKNHLEMACPVTLFQISPLLLSSTYSAVCRDHFALSGINEPGSGMFTSMRVPVKIQQECIGYNFVKTTCHDAIHRNI